MYDLSADKGVVMQTLTAISRFLNGLTGGSFDEMLCARAFRADYRGEGRLVRTIDAIMLALRGERGHCRNCALSEFLRGQRGEE